MVAQNENLVPSPT